jgi:hypothetical protein
MYLGAEITIKLCWLSFVLSKVCQPVLIIWYVKQKKNHMVRDKLTAVTWGVESPTIQFNMIAEDVLLPAGK